MAREFNWKTYEFELSSCLQKAVCGVMEEYPDERFYAAALHHFYRESGDLISMPCLAVNTEEEVDEDNLWSSPDWYWEQLPFTSRKLGQLHKRLNNEANSIGIDHWNIVHQDWMACLIRAAKHLTAKLKKRKQATKDFGFYLFDEESPDEVDTLRKCMTPAKFKRLFPRLHAIAEEKKADAKRPQKQKLAKYADDLWTHRDELVRQGENAIPILIGALDSKDGWLAASLLSKIGVASDKVITALRRQACAVETSWQRSHETGALALLGDVDFLLELAKNTKTRKIAIEGIKTLYAGTSGEDNVYVCDPLDYRPLERLIEIDSCRREVQKAPSRDAPFSYAMHHGWIRRGDVDEAIRGTESKYKMIREHAVCALGNRDLGKANSEKATQAIVNCFHDRAFTVRYLAAIRIGDWKKMAKHHLPTIRKLARNDPDPDVRDSARGSIREMGFRP